jgi:thioredoxin 1
VISISQTLLSKMKRSIFFSIIIVTVIFSSCNSRKTENTNNAITTGPDVQQLTTVKFKKLVYNYDENKDWKYLGSMPAIVDFYADWCPPCRALSPLVEGIAREYQGKLVVYRVNTDQEKELVQSLGITNLPTLLYIPVNGKPQVTLGMIPREKIINTINNVLLIK